MRLHFGCTGLLLLGVNCKLRKWAREEGVPHVGYPLKEGYSAVTLAEIEAEIVGPGVKLVVSVITVGMGVEVDLAVGPPERLRVEELVVD